MKDRLHFHLGLVRCKLAAEHVHVATERMIGVRARVHRNKCFAAFNQFDEAVAVRELARRLGKRQQFISLVENRERRLDIVEFCVFVRAIGADADAVVAELMARLPKDTRI